MKEFGEFPGALVGQRPTLPSAHVDCRRSDAIEELRRRLGPEPLAAVFLFVTSEADFDTTVARAGRVFGKTRVIACTTAGEIGSDGYAEGTIQAVGLPEDRFAVDTLLCDLDAIDQETLIGELIRSRGALARRAP